jgi:uncharacterized repeat protein (TIGR03803 family)
VTNLLCALRKCAAFAGTAEIQWWEPQEMHIDRRRAGPMILAGLLLASTTAAYPWPAWVKKGIYALTYYKNPQYTTLHSFNPKQGASGEGLFPLAGLTTDAGAIYGTTSAPGSAYTLLRPSGDSPNFKEIPIAALATGTSQPLTVVSDGVLAGVEPKDVFTLTLTNQGYIKQVIFTFPAGSAPLSGLTLYGNGTLFGASSGGQANNGYIYGLRPLGNSGLYSPQLVYGFTGGIGGGYPAGGVTVGSDGLLYGTTLFGGNSKCVFVKKQSGCGVIYRLAPSVSGLAYTETVLHSFAGGKDGIGAGGLIADASYNLYGATRYGGNGEGTVFALKASGGKKPSYSYATIYTFANTDDGHYPNPELAVDSGGALYGTAQGGKNKKGTVFILVPPAPHASSWSFELLHSFSGSTDDGAVPVGRLALDESGNVYGATYGGGQFNRGTDYQIIP